MESNKAITPEAMRVLLVALGAKQKSRNKKGFCRFELGESFLYVHDEDQDRNAKNIQSHWFILACANFLESEAVRKDYVVIHGNLDGGLTTIGSFKLESTKAFTGPFGSRVVAAAAAVAGMMGKEKKA